MPGSAASTSAWTRWIRDHRAITNGEVAPVLQGIQRVKELGFESVKWNTVLMRGRNDGEIFRLLEFAAEHDLAIRSLN